jgi:chorismate mutase / prephenate dehydratase
MNATSLDALRREIDKIDDGLHDLLMRRAEVVEAIRAAKNGGVAFRPGREAHILRRLVGRHRGAFPPLTLVRIWREVMGAMVRLQGPFTAAVLAGAEGYESLVRGEYGAATPIVTVPSAARALGTVRDGTATVAILPLPSETPADSAERPWWAHLLGGEGPRIVARLPFASLGPEVEALAVARLDAADTGEDRSFLGFETAEELSRTRLMDLVRGAGFAARGLSAWRDVEGGRLWLHLVEVDGHVQPDDPRLARLAQAADSRAVQVLGGYAVPLAPAVLEAPSAKA